MFETSIQPKRNLTNLNKIKNFEKENKSANEATTYSQSLCRIIDRKNDIFNNQGGLNLDFLRKEEKVSGSYPGKGCKGVPHQGVWARGERTS